MWRECQKIVVIKSQNSGFLLVVQQFPLWASEGSLLSKGD